jgi:uncharacterized phage protein (TIGR01671 family)
MFSPEEMGVDELQLNPDGRGFFNAHPKSTRLSEYYPHLVPLQFTGLKDMNGVEIYEGDLVKTNYGKIGTIVYHEESAAYIIHDKDHFNEFLYDEYSLEVIGNIFEHPHLLKPK